VHLSHEQWNDVRSSVIAMVLATGESDSSSSILFASLVWR
jgi:hypothetical protein